MGIVILLGMVLTAVIIKVLVMTPCESEAMTLQGRDCNETIYGKLRSILVTLHMKEPLRMDTESIYRSNRIAFVVLVLYLYGLVKFLLNIELNEKDLLLIKIGFTIVFIKIFITTHDKVKLSEIWNTFLILVTLILLIFKISNFI